MGLSIHTHSLSALTPVKFTYKFNKEEKLSENLNSFDNGFKYYKYNVFENFHDAVLSKKNCLVLTDTKSLKDVFESDSKQIDIGTIAGCIFLKTPSGKYFTSTLNDVYVGGTGEKLFINVFPISNNVVELRVGKTKRLQVEKQYPYTVKLTSDVLYGEDLNRQRFEVEYRDGKICFRTMTQEGFRYISHGADRVVRAVGLMLNDTVVNPYLLIPDFVSESGLYYNFDAKSSEVKYFNELIVGSNQSNLAIREEQESNTNLLISCTTSEIALSAEASVNIALMKTNFTSSGSYSTKRTP